MTDYINNFYLRYSYDIGLSVGGIKAAPYNFCQRHLKLIT